MKSGWQEFQTHKIIKFNLPLGWGPGHDSYDEFSGDLVATLNQVEYSVE